MTQRAMILAALADGPGTSTEIAAETGLPLRHCSAILHALWKIGKLWRSPQRKRHNPRSPSAHVYALKVYAPKVTE